MIRNLYKFMNKSKTYFKKWVKMLQFQDCDI